MSYLTQNKQVILETFFQTSEQQKNKMALVKTERTLMKQDVTIICEQEYSDVCVLCVNWGGEE